MFAAFAKMTRALLERIVVAHYRQFHVGLRGLQTMLMFVAFITATALTGLSSGDYALVLSYTLLIFGFVWTYVAVKKGGNGGLLPHGTQVTLDWVILIALLVAAIVLSASKWGRLCDLAVNCSAYQACITVLYIGVVVQIFMLLVLHFGRSMEGTEYATDPSTVQTPRTDYQHTADAAT
ncbi:hypothetical protein B5M09_006372 [Aphanomyces astaci]|uniref:MARVEL domain-containing protein n=2 Tax=Aphanomyces astaci TaxID=112090 RepID=A0A418G1E3_APHAT|nr:hypothetical protein DYB26_008297 [Aphanomyces astaci]RQM18939.1 hypothetical protein B5M09_006372 [Aphanomyces astaci]